MCTQPFLSAISAQFYPNLEMTETTEKYVMFTEIASL